jgi:hypothetical protein
MDAGQAKTIPGTGPLQARSPPPPPSCSTAIEGTMDTVTALTAITAARELAAGLEHGELAFINAARGGGATWSQVAAAMGARNRQTAQKRHADLARRHPCPPAVDIPPPAGPVQKETGHDDGPAAGDPPPRARARKPATASGKGRPAAPAAPAPAAAGTSAPQARTARSQRKQSLPTISDEIIREGIYELVRPPEHRETRTWHVMVAGTRVGLVRPTWRGERSRPGWEAADNTGLTLPPAGIGRITERGQRPDPRRRSSQPAPRTPAPAGKREQAQAPTIERPPAMDAAESSWPAGLGYSGSSNT